MKILHVINDATQGGAQTLICQLAEAWTAGDELHLIVLRGSGALSMRYEAAFASVQYLDVSARNSVRAMRVFSSAVRRLEPDIVHSHLLQSDLVNIILAPRTVRRFSTLHTTGMSNSDPLLSRLIGRVVGLLSNRFSEVIACDESCLTYARQMRYRRTPVVVPNALSLPAKIDYSSNSQVFVSAARFHPMKGHDVLIRAFASVRHRMPGWQLHCYGAGVAPDQRSLADVLAEPEVADAVESGSISLRGPVEDVSSIFPTASALVIASTYGEAMPMIAIEAIAHGVPVIATRVGGAPRFVFSEDALVEPGSIESLATAFVAFAALDRRDRAARSEWSRALALSSYDARERVTQLRTAYARTTAITEG